MGLFLLHLKKKQPSGQNWAVVLHNCRPGTSGGHSGWRDASVWGGGAGWEGARAGSEASHLRIIKQCRAPLPAECIVQNRWLTYWQGAESWYGLKVSKTLEHMEAWLSQLMEVFEVLSNRCLWRLYSNKVNISGKKSFTVQYYSQLLGPTCQIAIYKSTHWGKWLKT